MKRTTSTTIIACFIACLLVELAASFDSSEYDHGIIFRTYDFDGDRTLDRFEFDQLFLEIFDDNVERLQASPATTLKIFEYLDMDGDNRLSPEEWRKVYKHWFLPLVSTKSCLLICVPPTFDDHSNNSYSREVDKFEHSLARIIKGSSSHNIMSVYLSSCGGEEGPEDSSIGQYRHMVSQYLPKAFEFKLFDANYHEESMKNRDYHEMIIFYENASNFHSSQKFFDQILSLNGMHQHPTVILSDEPGRIREELIKQQNELKRREQQLLHQDFEQIDVIALGPDYATNAKKRAQYRTHMALQLARRLYRRYKQFPQSRN